MHHARAARCGAKVMLPDQCIVKAQCCSSCVFMRVRVKVEVALLFSIVQRCTIAAGNLLADKYPALISGFWSASIPAGLCLHEDRNTDLKYSVVKAGHSFCALNISELSMALASWAAQPSIERNVSVCWQSSLHFVSGESEVTTEASVAAASEHA